MKRPSPMDKCAVCDHEAKFHLRDIIPGQPGRDFCSISICPCHRFTAAKGSS